MTKTKNGSLYTDTKSKSNKTKHKIDFIEAHRLWEDPDLIEIPIKTSDEPRYLVMGGYLENNGQELLRTGEKI